LGGFPLLRSNSESSLAKDKEILKVLGQKENALEYRAPAFGALSLKMVTEAGGLLQSKGPRGRHYRKKGTSRILVLLIAEDFGLYPELEGFL